MTRVLFGLGAGLLATGLFYGGIGAAYWAIEDLAALRPGLALWLARALWVALDSVSLAAALGVWLLNVGLAAAAILLGSFTARGKAEGRAGRRAGVAAWFVHGAAAAHIGLTIPTIGYFADLFGILGVMALPLIWGEISAATLALLFVNRWRPERRRELAGAAIAAAAFGGAIWQTPTLYGWDLQPLGWYAWIAMGVPLALFAGRALEWAPALARAEGLRGGLALGIMAATIAATPAVMYTAAAAPEAFSEALEENLEAEAREVSFARLTDFDWDFVEIYATSYNDGGNGKEIDDISAAARRMVDTSTWAYMRRGEKSYHIAVFIKDGAAVYYETIPAIRVRFEDSRIGNPIVARYEAANFRVRYRDEGNGVYILRLARDEAPGPMDARVSRIFRFSEKL